MRAESRAGLGSSRKAVIDIHLDGGPPHLDLIDLKPQAPTEVRGEFNPIATRIPGFPICELLRIATIRATSVLTFKCQAAAPARLFPWGAALQQGQAKSRYSTTVWRTKR